MSDNCVLLAQREHVLVVSEPDGAFLVDTLSNNMFAINQSGLAIWTLCDGTRSADQIVGAVIQQMPHLTGTETTLRWFLGSLGKRGLIVERYSLRKKDADEIVEGFYVEYRNVPFPDGSYDSAAPRLTSLYLYVTDQCNLACRHCWITPHFADTFDSGQVAVEKYCQLIDQAHHLGLSSVKITGGEPCLWQGLPKLVEELARRRISVGVETNGTLISDDLAIELKVADAFVSVSLDGACAETHDWLRGIPHAYELALDGIRKLMKYGITPQIIMSVCKYNRNEVQLLMQMCESMGIKSMKINPITEIGRAVKMKEKKMLLDKWQVLELMHQVDQWQREMKVSVFFSYPCMLKSLNTLIDEGIPLCPFKNLLSVLADGSLTFCGYGSDAPEWVLGHIDNVDLKRLWESHPVMQTMRRMIPDELQGVCGVCRVKSVCQGGCRAEAVAHYGSLSAPHPHCQDFYELGLFPSSRITSVP